MKNKQLRKIKEQLKKKILIRIPIPSKGVIVFKDRKKELKRKAKKHDIFYDD